MALIKGMKSTRDLPRVLAKLHLDTFNLLSPTDSGGPTPGFFFASAQDFDDASMVVAIIDQAGLGLPDRGYYLKTDAKSVETRKAYTAHVARMLELAGEPKARTAADAQAILDLETALAKGSMDLVKRRDPKNLNHRLSLAQLQALTPSFDWKVYLAGVKMPPTHHFLVTSPDFLEAFQAQLQATGLPTWKAYLRWHLVTPRPRCCRRSSSRSTSASTDTRSPGPRSSRRAGSAARPRPTATWARPWARSSWRRPSRPRARSATSELVRRHRAALWQDIEHLDWMGAATKKQAHGQARAASSTRSATPTTGGTTRALTIARGAALANAPGQRLRVAPAAGQDRQAGRPQPSGT